jgi:excisionase family DNA binding protein
METHRDSCLTAAELAERLRVTTPTVLRWHRAGRIPVMRVTGKVLRFDLIEVLSVLKRSAEGEGVAQ